VRRSDVIAVAALLALVHALLAVGEARGLRFHLDHLVNAALLVTNLYALVGLYIVTRRFRWPIAALYVVGYALIFYVYFLFEPDWQPSFFLYAVLYASLFRLPLGIGLLAIYMLSNAFAQPYPAAAFVSLGATFAVAYAARRRGAGWFRVACLALGAGAFLVLLFPITSFLLMDTPQTLLETLREPDVAAALKTSLLSASIATVVGLVFGVPLAYALARARFTGRGVLETAVDVPILIPQSAAGIAFLWILGEKGPLGSVLQIPGTLAGVIIAQTFVSAPFLIKTAMTAFESVSPHYEAAARTLGATEWGAFWRVSLPLAGRGVFVGCILAWSRAISEVGSVALLAYRPITAPILVFAKGSQVGVAEARPIAVLLVLACVWIFVGLHVIRSVAFRRFVAGASSASA
jgi:molybdate/tungstate transport system permease protein